MIIEGIINRPFGSEERIRFILDNLPEFLMLADYYNVSVSNGSGGYANPMESKFFPLIIAHRSENSEDLDSLVDQFLDNPAVSDRKKWKADYLKVLKDVPLDMVKIILGKILDYMKLATSVKPERRDIPPKPYYMKLATSVNEDDVLSVKAILTWLVKNVEDPIKSFSDYLLKLSSEAKAPSNKDEVRSLVDSDIDCLKEIFDKSIAGAIDLETAFINFNIRTIDYIRESAKPGDKLVDDWIKANIGKLKRKELEEAEAKARAAGTRKVIREEIEDIMKGAE